MSQKKTPRELSPTERKRLHVAAMVTHEKEWPQSEPNQGLARMFVIMLLVHVVVIGGVIVYDFVSEPATTSLVTTSGKKSATTAAAHTTAATTAPLPVVKDAPSIVAVPEKPVTPAPTAAALTPVPVAPAVVETPKAASPESLLPAQFASMPVVMKNDNTSKPLAITTSIPAPEPKTVKVEDKLPVKKATRVEDEPAAPPVAKRATIVTETSEKPTSSLRAKSSSTDKSSSTRRTETANSSQPKPVATPSAARRELAIDDKPTTKKRTVQDAPPAKKTTASGSKHAVAKGETIYSIARKFKVSEESLMKANNIKSANSLQIGKSLVIPAK